MPDKLLWKLGGFRLSVSAIQNKNGEHNKNVGGVMAFHQDRSTGRQGYAKAVVPRTSLAWHTKRLLDITLAVTCLLLLSPLIVLVAAAIKLESSGPIFCREILYGHANQAIRAFKFRSIMSCTETAQIRSRVTRVGRVLRHTGIDELPQLINVLLGEMSIVGPRAYVRRQELLGEHFRPMLKGFKPGLTGWAQLLEVRNGLMTAEQRIAADLFYVKNWSLFFDVRIILMTFLLRKPEHAAD